MRSAFCLSAILLASGIGATAAWIDFGIPHSSSTVDIRAFNVANAPLVNQSHAFIHPVVSGHENATFTMFAFLVEHTKSRKRLLFDLGIRKDPLNLAPSIRGLFTSGIGQLEMSGDITDLLRTGGIPLDSIDSVIWSHAHFDHIGDMSKFPNTTRLIIGSETNTETYPDFPNAPLQASDLANRTVIKIDFATANLTLSGLKAIDYFGDGSFYLLNTPGHLAGHITALARVTPTSFIVLGGDTFHHVGEARPRPAFQKNFPCPAHLLEEAKTSISTDYFWSPKSRDGAFDMLSRSQQLFAISDTPDSFYEEPVTAQISLDKLSAFDADPDIFVVIAHDISLRDVLPYFPKYLNDWKKNGLKKQTVWNFVEKANPASVFTPVQ
ncbi:Metallo-beta-lactamase superfamily protein [Favolaschia claudopus]|uniref:Metallo-beta-lactamase superfamily protein n=1 Tax=Favolaschia claudopus TaxID=2862362 RepID=A0AAW0BFU2_9AGAR